MAFDAKKVGSAVVSTVASFSLLMGPATAETFDFKSLMETPSAAVQAAPAPAPAPARTATAPAPAAAASPDAAALKLQALALKAELAASLPGAKVETKVAKNFATSAPKEAKSAEPKAAAVAKDASYVAPTTKKAPAEAGDPSFKIAMLVVFSPFALVTGYIVLGAVGALRRKFA